MLGSGRDKTDTISIWPWHWKSCILCQDLKNEKYSFRTQFLDLGLGWGLYIRHQDTVRATRRFLVRFTASRPLCRGIFALVSIIDMCSRDISNTHIIEDLIFSIRIRHDVNLIDRTDPPGRESSRRTTKSVQKWFLCAKNRSWWFFWYFEASTLFF